MSPMVYESVQEHGATGAGSTDDAPAIQSAIDAVERDGGGTVYFPAGTYLISRTLHVRGDHIRLLLDRATLQTAHTTVNPAIAVSGSREADVALATDALRSNIFVHAPGHGFRPGDWVELISDDAYQANVPMYGEQHKILRVTGDRFEVHDRLYENYRTAANARVRRVNHVKDFTLQGGALSGSGQSAGQHVGIAVEYGNGAVVRDVRLTNFEWAAVVLRATLNAAVQSCVVHDMPSQTQGYAVLLENSSQWVTMSNCTVTRCGSAVDNGGLSSEHGAARFVSVFGNTAGEMTRRAFAMHENGFDWTFLGNIASCRLGSGIGFFIRGSHVTLNANTIKFTNGDAIAIALRTHEDASYLITDNVIENARANGIHIAASVKQGGYLGRAVIANNVVQRAGLRGIYLDLRTAGSACRRITINGNSLQAGTDGIAVRAQAVHVDAVSVVGNSLTGSGQSRGVRFHATSPASIRNSTVVGNTISDFDEAVSLVATEHIEVGLNASG